MYRIFEGTASQLMFYLENAVTSIRLRREILKLTFGRYNLGALKGDITGASLQKSAHIQLFLTSHKKVASSKPGIVAAIIGGKWRSYRQSWTLQDKTSERAGITKSQSTCRGMTHLLWRNELNSCISFKTGLFLILNKKTNSDKPF